MGTRIIANESATTTTLMKVEIVEKNKCNKNNYNKNNKINNNSSNFTFATRFEERRAARDDDE